MSAPQENVYGISYSGIRCQTKEEAIKVANYLAKTIQSWKGYAALGFIVVSNMNPQEATLRVSSSQHKIITDRSWLGWTDKDWHVHISCISFPGNAFKKKISELLKSHYPSHLIVYEKRDPNVVGKYAADSINYFLAQSVILRTFAVGDHAALCNGNDYLSLFCSKATKMGYSRLLLLSQKSPKYKEE